MEESKDDLAYAAREIGREAAHIIAQNLRQAAAGAIRDRTMENNGGAPIATHIELVKSLACPEINVFFLEGFADALCEANLHHHRFFSRPDQMKNSNFDHPCYPFITDLLIPRSKEEPDEPSFLPLARRPLLDELIRIDQKLWDPLVVLRDKIRVKINYDLCRLRFSDELGQIYLGVENEVLFTGKDLGYLSTFGDRIPLESYLKNSWVHQLNDAHKQVSAELLGKE